MVLSGSKNKQTPRSYSLLTEAGKFETKTTFKMDAKKNDGNEHEQKKSPLTSFTAKNVWLVDARPRDVAKFKMAAIPP